MEWISWILEPHYLAAFVTLTVLEIVLGVDNIIFISILAGKLPAAEQPKARRFGLIAALVSRIILLLSLSWIMRLTTPLFTIFEQGVSGKDLILIVGGLFLIAKSTSEIHAKLEGAEHEQSGGKGRASLAAIIVQVFFLDTVFALDSIITAVGMASHIPVMVAAVIASVGVMMFLAGPIHEFVQRHPTVKMLALSFLLLIGTTLVAEGFHKEIPKGYVYFAMAFSVAIELLNMRMRRKAPKPVELRTPYAAD
jgi:predicted tellurium resistance membrane protein TerC